MIPFSYFIIGFLFVTIGIPIIESVVELIILSLEVLKSKLSVHLTRNNTEVKKIAFSGQEEKRTIGFVYEGDDDEDE